MIWAFEGEKEIKNANICRQWVAQILGLLKETKHSKMSVCVTLPVGWGVDLDAGSEERERERENVHVMWTEMVLFFKLQLINILKIELNIDN